MIFCIKNLGYDTDKKNILILKKIITKFLAAINNF